MPKGRPYDTLNTGRGKARLNRQTPHVVTLFLATLDKAYAEDDRPTLLKCIEIFFKKTIPDLSAVEYSVDNDKTLKLLQDIKQWQQIEPSTETKITTVELLEPPKTDA